MCSRCIIRSIIRLSLRTLTVGHLLLPPTTTTITTATATTATTTATITTTLHHYRTQNSRLPKRPKHQIDRHVDDNDDHNNDGDDDGNRRARGENEERSLGTSISENDSICKFHPPINDRHHEPNVISQLPFELREDITLIVNVSKIRRKDSGRNFGKR